MQQETRRNWVGSGMQKVQAKGEAGMPRFRHSLVCPSRPRLGFKLRMAHPRSRPWATSSSKNRVRGGALMGVKATPGFLEGRCGWCVGCSTAAAAADTDFLAELVDLAHAAFLLLLVCHAVCRPMRHLLDARIETVCIAERQGQTVRRGHQRSRSRRGEVIGVWVVRQQGRRLSYRPFGTGAHDKRR